MRNEHIRKGNGFLLILSITSRSTLDELHGLHEEILRIIDRDHVPIIVIGNKADLEDEREVSREKGLSMSGKALVIFCLYFVCFSGDLLL